MFIISYFKELTMQSMLDVVQMVLTFACFIISYLNEFIKIKNFVEKTV